MGKNLRFLLWITVGAGSLVVILAYPILTYFSPDIFHAFVWGAILSFFIILFAFFINSWALKRSGKAFYRAVFGGMAVRFLLVTLSLFYVWKFTELNLIVFVVSLMGFYLLLQILEIRYIQKNLLKR